MDEIPVVVEQDVGSDEHILERAILVAQACPMVVDGLAPRQTVAKVLEDVRVGVELGAVGFDHGVGHPLLLLYNAKTPRGQNGKEFNGLGDNPLNASVSLF